MLAPVKEGWNTLRIFEGKILRMIYGAGNDNGVWKTRYKWACTLYDEPDIVSGQNRKIGWLEHLFRLIVMSWGWVHFRKPVGYGLSLISPSTDVKVPWMEKVLILMHLLSWVKCLPSWQCVLYQVRDNTFKMSVSGYWQFLGYGFNCKSFFYCNSFIVSFQFIFIVGGKFLGVSQILMWSVFYFKPFVEL